MTAILFAKLCGVDSWDILDLKAQNYTSACNEVSSKNSESCQQTASVEGECFYMGQVNYVLYGRMLRPLREVGKVEEF